MVVQLSADNLANIGGGAAQLIDDLGEDYVFMEVVIPLRTLAGDSAQLLGAVLVADPHAQDLSPRVPLGLGR
jgi:hypothetical protein